MRASANSAPPIFAALSASVRSSFTDGSIGAGSWVPARRASASARAREGEASASALAAAPLFRKSRLVVMRGGAGGEECWRGDAYPSDSAHEEIVHLVAKLSA